MKKILLTGGFLLLVIAVYDSSQSQNGQFSLKLPSFSVVPPKDTLKIVAVGDIMLGTSYPDSTFLPAFPAEQLFKPLQPYLRGADICFGNLEGVLTDDLSEVKECYTEGRCYYFAMPTSYAQSLKTAGFNVLSLANNHMNDFGYIGRRSTRRSLRKAGIHFAGLLEAPLDTFRIAGVKYGFCAFSPNAGMTSVKDLKKAKRLVHRLDSMCDVVMVSFHAGGEGVDVQNVTREKEFYIGEDRGNVYEFAHGMIDAGADVLLGHGPHVTRAVEVYNKRFIAYSLGNFCTYSRVSVAGRCGQAPLLHLYVNRSGEFLRAQVIPVLQRKYKAPVVDVSKRALAQLQNLTRNDFPEMEGVINIDDNGWILPAVANMADEKASPVEDASQTKVNAL